MAGTDRHQGTIAYYLLQPSRANDPDLGGATWFQFVNLIDGSSNQVSDLDRVLADYMRRIDGGEKIDQESFIQTHPELADELRAHFSQPTSIDPPTYRDPGDDWGSTERAGSPRSGAAKCFVDRSRRLRTVWRFLIFGFGVIGIQIIVGVFAGILYFGGLLLTEQDFNLDRVSAEENLWVLQAIASPLVAVLALALVLLCRVFLDRRSVGSMGFVTPRDGWGLSVVGGLLFGAVPVVVGALVIWSIGGYQCKDASASIATLILIPTLVFAALTEEVIFRSYLLQNLIDIDRPIFGVVFSSIVFWLVHIINPHALEYPLVTFNLFSAGVLLALAYLVGQNIWFPTVLHFAWNFAQGPLLGIPVSGIEMDGFLNLELTGELPVWLSGGEFGFEASLLCTLANISVIVFFVVLLMRRQSNVPMETVANT